MGALGSATPSAAVALGGTHMLQDPCTGSFQHVSHCACQYNHHTLTDTVEAWLTLPIDLCVPNLEMFG